MLAIRHDARSASKRPVRLVTSRIRVRSNGVRAPAEAQDRSTRQNHHDAKRASTLIAMLVVWREVGAFRGAPHGRHVFLPGSGTLMHAWTLRRRLSRGNKRLTQPPSRRRVQRIERSTTRNTQTSDRRHTEETSAKHWSVMPAHERLWWVWLSTSRRRTFMFPLSVRYLGSRYGLRIVATILTRRP